jgi:hypothetical protein
MDVPNYTYVKLKMLGLAGTITMGTMAQRAYKCEVKCCDLAEKVSTAQELQEELRSIDKQAPDVKRASTTFKAVTV